MAYFFTKLISFLFILIHLGCFIIFPTSDHHHHHRRRRRSTTRKPSSPLPLLRPTTSKLKPHKTLSNSWSFIKQFFSKSSRKSETDYNSSIIHHVPASPASSTRSFRNSAIAVPGSCPGSVPGSVSLTEPDFFPLRNDIYPCPDCGEVFQKPGLLEQHAAFKHAVTELFDQEPGNNIVRIIFRTGWPGSGNNENNGKNPVIYRVMKIHNSPKILARFEEYREAVKSKAARFGAAHGRRDERCIADGNELLRFHCATFLCDLGQNGNSSICSHQYCSVCGVIRVGFSSKMDGISTFSTSWKGHVALPDDIEEEFRFMHVKRAMLVCRVVAGRVGCEPGIGDKDDPGYDSVVGGAEDELIVFNPRAVLPCFVIAYTV